MPKAFHHDVAINYQVTGRSSGPPLLLHHGFTQNLYSWHMRGYVKALEEDFLLILPDARGHGQSDKPQEKAAYAMTELVGDLLAVLDDLAIEQSHFLGYSMGGRIGLALAQQAPQRLAQLMVGGAYPNSEDLAAFQDVDGRDAQVFMAAFEAMIGEQLSPLAQEFVLANDLVALAAAAQPQPTPGGNRAARELIEWTVPTLMFAGEGDRRFKKIKAYAATLPGARFEAIPGLNHVGTMNQRQAVLPLLRSFLKPAADLA